MRKNLEEKSLIIVNEKNIFHKIKMFLINLFARKNTIIDKKFKRNFALYRKFGSTQIFRTNLYTVCNDKIGLDTSRYVYYLLENNIVYYLGIDLNEKDLTTYLFNK